MYKKIMGKDEKLDTIKLQVSHAGCFVPIFHLEIWDNPNKRKSPQDRKESEFIFKEVMTNKGRR